LEPTGPRDVTLLATGSEVSLVVTAAERLSAEGIKAAVVSVPCFELFEALPRAERAAVLGDAPRIAVEAAVRQSWDRWLGPHDRFIGMTSFGASAPAAELYEEFGITVEAIVTQARARLAPIGAAPE
jgi:transketolase